MSEHQPPSGTPDYLEHGAATPPPPTPDYAMPGAGQPQAGGAGGSHAGRRGGRRRGWWIGGGLVAVVALGAGAWAALGFFHQGAQPAQALPASTVAYVSVDLDPAGGQKIDAFRTLNKFPAFKNDVGIDSVDQLRHKLGDQVLEASSCSSLSFDRDIDPWLGDRMAVAVVEVDGHPHVVGVVQVTDDGKARAGITKINACSNSGDDGVVVQGGWAILASSQEIADQVSTEAEHATLADDATYQKWTKAVGEAGVVNAYVAPSAGRVLAQELAGSLGDLFSMEPRLSAGAGTAAQGSSSAYTSTLTVTPDPSTDPLTGALSGFRGGAATLRFTGDGLELAMAGDGSGSQLSQITGNTGGTLVARLPADTAAAAGVTLPPGWLDRELGRFGGLGAGMSKAQLERELSQQTGLDVPSDIETLLGSGVSVSVGKDFDLEAAENSSNGSGLPIAVTVKGDPAAIDQVLGKLRAKLGGVPFLGSDSKGDLEVIGPSAAYRQQVLAGGSLGGDGAFSGVVPDAGAASSLFYVDVDAFEPSLTKVLGDDQQSLDNLTPLRAVGMSTWRDSGGVVRFSLKVTTN